MDTRHQSATLRAMSVHRCGGPEVFALEERPLPQPGPGEALIAHDAVGVNFVDLNHRAGAPYPVEPPFVPGIEAVGRVVALGDGADPAWQGAFVGYAGPMPGAYASHSVLGTDLLVRIDEALAPTLAAAVLMQGMTAAYLHGMAAPRRDDIVLIHAAASGVGRHLARLCKVSGAIVIGTSRRADGIDTMRADGIDHPLLVTDAPMLTRTISAALGGPHRVAVVLDSLGGPYALPGLRTLRPRGRYVNYGLAAGMPPPIVPAALSGFFNDGLAGSLSMAWASLGNHLDSPSRRQAAADSVFFGLADGLLVPPPVRTFPLGEAAAAHEWLEIGAGGGKAVLLP